MEAELSHAPMRAVPLLAESLHISELERQTVEPEWLCVNRNGPACRA